MENKKPLIWAALTVPILITIIVIWFPFGFTITGLIEEWGVLASFVCDGLYFIANPESPMASQALRPLTILPHAIAYLLDPNSFNYWHIVLMLALFIKGSAASHLIWRATGSLKWAIAMGILVLVYPADSMQLSFRSLHINLALALQLLASSLFVIAYEQRRLSLSYALAIPAAALFFAACCMYEVSLALAPLPLLIPFIRNGLCAFWSQLKTRMGPVLLWLAGGGLYIVHVLLTAPKLTHSYQIDLVGNPITTLACTWPALFSVGTLRGLLGGWFDAIRMIPVEFSSYVYLAATTILVGSFFLLVKQNTESTPKFLPLRMGVAGLLLMFLGYAPFLLLSPEFLKTTQRTFLWATPGAALVWIALLILISRSTQWFSRFATLALIFFGLGAQLFQFHHFVQLSVTQCSLLKNIVENFDGNLGDKTLLILDESNQLGHFWVFQTDLSNALSYLYGRPVTSVEVCRVPSNEWQHVGVQGRKGICIEKENSWVFRYPDGDREREVPKSQVMTLTIHSDGSSTPSPTLNGYREKLLKDESVAAQRYRRILAKSCPPNLELFKNKQLQDQYTWSFGDWWRFDVPKRGAGWHEAEWTLNPFYHQSWAWQREEKATLYFDFSPTQNQYLLRGRFKKIKDPVRQSLQISLNQTELSCRWVSNDEFEAKIHPDTLLSGVNEITFNAPNSPPLSVRLSGFDIFPLQ